MNADTVARLRRSEHELGGVGDEYGALMAHRLRRVAEMAERLTESKALLAERLAEGKSHGATLRQLAEVSGLSIEGVRQIIQKGESK